MGGTILKAQKIEFGTLLAEDAYGIMHLMNENHKDYKA